MVEPILSSLPTSGSLLEELVSHINSRFNDDKKDPGRAVCRGIDNGEAVASSAAREWGGGGQKSV